MLTGKKVMISAGANGIGYAMASAFLSQNATVHICDIAPASLALAAEQLPGLHVYQADMSQPSQVDAWFEHALTRMEGLDILINNVGIAGPTKSIGDILPEEWDQTMAINVRSQFLCIKKALPALRASGQGTIINMSSVAGRLGYPLRTPYAASKWAIIGMTESLAIELGGDNITVNCILPGIVESDRSKQVTEMKAQARNISYDDMLAEILGKVSLHRMVPMQDIAATALFLASPAGRSITGQNMNICAGIQSLS